MFGKRRQIAGGDGIAPYTDGSYLSLPIYFEESDGDKKCSGGGGMSGRG